MPKYMSEEKQYSYIHSDMNINILYIIYWNFSDFPGVSASKESTCSAGDLDSIPGLGRSPGDRNSYPLQYSGLENPMDCIVHGVAKNQTQRSNFHFTGSSQGALLVKNPPTNTGNTGDASLIPGQARSLGGENGSPLQCSCLENPMDREAWRAPVHGVEESDMTE